jgi:nucleoside-diphosphate-sugar epimerase/short-subunit dehydrogenase
MNSKNIYVLGGAGFLGKDVIKLLQQTENYIIYCLDLNIQNEDQHNICFDICNYKSFEKIIDADIIINCVGIIKFKKSDKKILNKIHVTGTKNILKFCKEKNINHYIHVSSIACMGYSHNNKKITEKKFGNRKDFKQNVYAISKYNSDLLVRKYKKEGHNVSIIYPGVIIGPGGSVFLENLKKKIPLFSPNNISPWVDVRDVSQAIETIVKNKIYDNFILVSQNVSSKQFLEFVEQEKNFNNKKVYTIPNFLYKPVRLIVNVFENKIPISKAQIDQGFHCRKSDSSKAYKILKWKPKYTLKESIKEMVKEIRPVYIVIGGSKGVGKSTIELLLKKNCMIYNFSRSPFLPDNENLINIEIDVKDLDKLKKNIIGIFNKHQKISAIFASTGNGMQKKLSETKIEELNHIFDVNFKYLFVVCKTYYQLQKKEKEKGNLLVVSSLTDRFSMPKYSAYSSAKHSVRSMLTSFKKEQKIIKIHIIHPFRIDTDFFNNYEKKPRKWEMIKSKHVAKAFVARKDNILKGYYYDLNCVAIRVIQLILRKQI